MIVKPVSNFGDTKWGSGGKSAPNRPLSPLLYDKKCKTPCIKHKDTLWYLEFGSHFWEHEHTSSTHDTKVRSVPRTHLTLRFLLCSTSCDCQHGCMSDTQKRVSTEIQERTDGSFFSRTSLISFIVVTCKLTRTRQVAKALHFIQKYTKFLTR